jgi:ribonuclease-3
VNEGELLEKIGYQFRDMELLETALNHSSWINEQNLGKPSCNERLEFLGDAILEGFISELLYRRLPDVEEGELTKRRSYIVCEKSLFRSAGNFSLESFLNLGRGEEASGGRRRASVVADAMEALIGAIYLDGGRDAAERFVMEKFESVIAEAMAISGDAVGDYKSRLQETLQAEGQVSIRYHVEKEEGPDHDKLFYVRVCKNGAVIGRGAGRNKKQAEQDAARQALQAAGGKR